MTQNIQIPQEKKTTTVATFNQYGKHFQECVMQALLVDKQFADQMLEVFDTAYFDLKYLAFLAERYFAYARKYKVFPTLQLLLTIIKDELKLGTDAVVRDQIIDYLQRMRINPSPGDLEYVKDKALDFCRKQALKAALEDAVDQMQANKYEQIVEGIKKAVCVGTTPAIGHDFFADYESRFTLLQRNCIATGLKELDAKEIFNGGLGSGELGIVVAATGVGKCVKDTSQITIKYTSININGTLYKPWHKVLTMRGKVYARDLVSSDEII